MNLSTVMVLALTYWAEARGEGFAGMCKVADTAWNRACGDRERLVAVCLAPKQYSCWNGAAGRELAKTRPRGEAWKTALAIARMQAAGQWRPQSRATHYHAANMRRKPSWASRMVMIEQYKNHVFYAQRGNPKSQI